MDMLLSRRIDCVVLELALPEHNGFKILVELVPLARKPKIPVVVLTVLTQLSVWKLATYNGAYTCLAKELTTGEELHQKIQRAIASVGRLSKEDRSGGL